MTKYVHIVYVHTVENGEVNSDTVIKKCKFEEQWEADACIDWLNYCYKFHHKKAVYHGRVNDETGELE